MIQILVSDEAKGAPQVDVMRITDARGTSSLILLFLVLLCAFCQGFTNDLEAKEALLAVNAASQVGQKIPETLFGVFFEEINHAGTGGLWAELVSNRGFEAGGQNVPSNIEPWSVIGNDSNIIVATDRSSCFANNKIALRMDVLCDENGENSCPAGGVGVYNPGFWGMNIEQGKSYKVILHVKSLQSSCISVSLTSPYGSQVLASKQFLASAFSDWNKVEFLLEANSTNRKSRLQLTTNNKGTVWFDQVSVMPVDTHKGHGFRKDLFSMVADLKPAFIRFPGGCFVEGEWLRNAFRWRETIGPWEERPGHFGDVWMYWSDDGLGYYEYLILAEDLNTIPIWVFNNGISHNDEVDPSSIAPFVQDVLDSIEFARGDPDTKWGAVRAKMGHPDPFPLKYVAIGNEDCWKKNYLANYLKFYNAIRHAYPDIKMISNCDGSSRPLDHPADLYDFHIYTSASSMFSTAQKFDHVSRKGPKAFVSEYAVTNKADAGTGTFVAALAEAAFLIGLERNSDIVGMASYAPLFVNTNDRRWNPDAIVFDSWQNYGTPSYWMQHFFKESNGAIYHPVSLYSNNSNSLVASAITWKKAEDHSSFLRIKIVNFGTDPVNFKISLVDLENDLNLSGSTITILSGNLKDENSFDEPNKVIPMQAGFDNAGKNMVVNIKSYSLTAIDLSLAQEVTHSAI